MRDKIFVVTGKLAIGTRDEVAEMIRMRDGICEHDVTRRTDYLVEGSLLHKHPVEEGRSSKVIKAETMMKNGGKIRIITEKELTEMLFMLA